jgi:hypothetical protein
MYDLATCTASSLVKDRIVMAIFKKFACRMLILLATDLIMIVSPATAPVLVANCARLAPYVGRVATAIGVEEIYRRVTNFFSEKASEGNKDSGSSKERIQNSPQEVGNYFQELKKLNVLGKGKRTTDGHWAYEIVKDFSYKGEKFQKGNFISRDRLHHEIEWFKDKNTHLGAIEPKGGTRYKIGDPTRKLRFK